LHQARNGGTGIAQNELAIALRLRKTVSEGLKLRVKEERNEDQADAYCDDIAYASFAGAGL
jgi:hypothetical protein